MHPACSAEVGRCPTLGCSAQPVTVQASWRFSIPFSFVDAAVIAALAAALVAASGVNFRNAEVVDREWPRPPVRITDEIR